MSASVRQGAMYMILMAVLVPQGFGMGEESFGPAGEHISRTAEWPRGVEDVLRHPARVYRYWVNGNEHAFYDGDIEKINQLLDLFSKIDLSAHRVIVRPGRPEARSFQGLLTAYNVEFELPSGIYLHHIRELAITGLYSTTPRLIIHIDDTLARQLDELKVPANVTVQAWAHRGEDALAQLNGSLRSRAITVLGEAGDSSPAILEALQRCAAEDDAHISSIAKGAMEQIEAANAPASRALREQIAGFLMNHPQRRRTPTPQELLAALQSVDAKYAEGFTAKGTVLQATLSGHSKLIAWTITMGDGRMVIQQHAVEDEAHPATEGQLENTLYTGPNQMGTIQRSRLWVDGKLIETTPHASFEPVGSTYDILIGRMLWPLGRGFSRRIDKVTEVQTESDGSLKVTAESDRANLFMRWELRIDPNADYLIHYARAFRRDQSEPSYVVDNLGVQAAAGRNIAHTSRWCEGASASPVSILVTSVSDKTDSTLIRQTEERLQQLRNGP